MYNQIIHRISITGQFSCLMRKYSICEYIQKACWSITCRMKVLAQTFGEISQTFGEISQNFMDLFFDIRYLQYLSDVFIT